MSGIRITEGDLKIEVICADIDQYYLVYNIGFNGSLVNSKYVPRELFSNINIELLGIAYFNLTKLPYIHNLVNLEEFGAYSNNLTKIPDILLKKNKLTKVLLLNNSITEIPPNMNIDNVILFVISNNPIQYFPTKIGNLLNITVCKLCKNEKYDGIYTHKRYRDLPKNPGNHVREHICDFLMRTYK